MTGISVMTVIVLLLTGCKSHQDIQAKVSLHPKTFCNPLNINYRFMVIGGGDGIREAADPVVVQFKDMYLLFASKSSGYWYSKDFAHWTHVFISDDVLPIEDYAPAIFVHNGYVYYVGSTRGEAMLYRSSQPEKGLWQPVKRLFTYWDPAFLVEDGKLYVYYGSSPSDPIRARVFDLNTLEQIAGPIDCLNSDQKQHGWERPGEANELTRRPYIEGAWMTKHNGKYYLQYAGPGTEWKSYADAVYVGDTPIGPFTYMPNSPTSYRPAGFMAGAGHGCLFQADDQWWKAATNSISIRHMFERRLSFYPSAFDRDGYLFTDTYLGDYPLYLPGSEAAAESRGPQWMLLSGGRPVKASSSLDKYPATQAVDEEARTAWVAAANRNEWLQIDLEREADIHAIQINYDEYGANFKGMGIGRYQSYRLYASHDGAHWSLIVDRSDKRTDLPHDYIEFERPFRARYIKWENVAYTISGQVSLRDLRVFGRSGERKPAAASGLTVQRDSSDPCKATISWQPAKGAEGYVVRYGIAKDKLYSSWQVISGTRIEIGSLNAGVPYYFTVDAYNGGGVTPGKEIQHAN